MKTAKPTTFLQIKRSKTNANWKFNFVNHFWPQYNSCWQFSFGVCIIGVSGLYEVFIKQKK